jgi:hypothetical protein
MWHSKITVHAFFDKKRKENEMKYVLLAEQK